MPLKKILLMGNPNVGKSAVFARLTGARVISSCRKQNVDMEHLTAMLHRIAEGVFAVDSEKHITFFNRAAERITGFSAKDAIGQPCRDVFRADVCGEQCILEEVQETGKSVNDRRVTIVDSAGRSLALRTWGRTQVTVFLPVFYSLDKGLKQT